ncbi:uncharacterized protein LOC134261634 [Saccostrea cucullata]|uniref:uncharacterized protein LOC134261634 n=1 Tax=Saccostrea cuccullata TaxID=36930 RepID=UPI002ED678B0
MNKLLRRFHPISKEWQQNTCEKIGLTFRDLGLYDEIYDNQNLGKPLDCLKIIGDGNCLFRCFACAICGDQETHSYFRQIITSFISERKEAIYNNEYPREYLERSRMRERGVWGTEIELHYSALCFNITIYVYTKYGPKHDWLEFKPTSQTDGKAIYLYHKDGNHYDIVRSVSTPDVLCTPGFEEETVILTEDSDTPEDSSVINLSDFLKGMSFEDENGSSNMIDDNALETSKTDPFEFEDEDFLSYSPIPKKQTSTPKKSKLKPLKVEIETGIMDVSSDIGQISQICSDISICNSSFEEALKNSKPKKYALKKNNSLLLRKALRDVPLSMSKRKRCRNYCLQHISEEMMKNMRYKFWTKQFEQRVEWFIDKISESKKNQNSICFQIESGKTVCGSCFRFLLRMNRNFYYTYLRMANDGKTAAGYRNTRGCGMAKEGAIVWLQNYQFFHADRMPDNGDMMLPFKTKKRDIYNMYVEEKIECLERSVIDALTVSQSAFYDIWKNEFPHLKIKQTNSFSKCSTCVHIERELEKTRDLSKRTKLKQMMRVHNQRQM